MDLFINEMSIQAYKNLLKYATLRCDMFSFGMEDYGVQGDYNKYYIECLMETLKPYSVPQKDKPCPSELFGGYEEVFVYYLNEGSIKNFYDLGGLFALQRPHWPEDLCFYSKGKMWMESITHENFCWIHTDSDLEMQIIDKIIGLKFVIEK